MTERRYFTEQDARDLLGLRVQPRVATIRIGLPGSKRRLIISSGARGTAQFASGPYPDSYLVGVAWDDPRPLVPRCNRYPIDWYLENEFRDLLEASVEGKDAKRRAGRQDVPAPAIPAKQDAKAEGAA